MISIIIPVYNAEKYLEKCFSSILNQTYDNFEVICVDDGSIDNSKAICNEWCLKDSRFRYVYQDNEGVSVARNAGVEKAKGEYICFVDADDYIDEHYLEYLLEIIDNHDAVICDLTRDDGLGEKGSVKEENPQKLIRDVIFERIKHPGLYCFLYKASIINSYGIRFTEGCIKNEDTEFYIRYLAACKKTIAITSYVGYYYRPNPSSVMAAPLSIRSFTSIEASGRINELLYKSGIIDDDKIVLYNGVLTYAYSIAKRHDIDLYDYLHSHYDVKAAMRRMLSFPRFSKKLVAISYLTLGKKLFFYTIGLKKIKDEFLRTHIGI